MKTKRRSIVASEDEIDAMRVPGRHSVGESLIVSVTDSGSRSWIARVRDATGKRRDIGLGPLTDVTLNQARKKAIALRNTGRDGLKMPTKDIRREEVANFDPYSRQVIFNIPLVDEIADVITKIGFRAMRAGKTLNGQQIMDIGRAIKSLEILDDEGSA